MNVRPLLLLLLAATMAGSALSAHAQSAEFYWARQIGNDGFDQINSVVTDPLGNFYVSGIIPVSGEASEGDLAVTKYNSAGAFQWQYTAVDPGNTIINAAATDPFGNVYAVGNNTINGDVFVIKLSTHGEFQWQQFFPSGDADSIVGRDIVVDALGNAYVTGSFGHSVDTTPGNAKDLLLTTGMFDVFVCKLDIDGVVHWTHQIGGSDTQFSTGIALAASGNPIVIGFYRGTTDFTSEGPSVASAGGSDTFVCELNLFDGTFVRGKSFGGTGDDAANDIAVDKLGRMRLAGVFTGTADFDPSPGVIESTAQAQDMFLLTLDSEGQYVQHVTFGGAGNDLINAIAVDAVNNVYFGGAFSGTVDFGQGSGTSTLSATTAQDMCIVKLSPNDNFVWGVGLVASNFSAISSVAVSPLGTVAGAGFVAGPFFPNTSIVAPAEFTATTIDGFIATYTQEIGGVEFADPQLEAAIREVLSIPNGAIPPLSLSLLTELNLSGRGIQMLDGLEFATGLQSLDLSYNAITALDPLLNNAGIDSGDTVALYGNPLPQSVICDDISELEGRGVAVGFDGLCGAANTVRVQGFVTDGDTPLVNAALLISQDDMIVGTAVVDEGGYYEVNGLTVGANYTFEFFALGYIPEVVTRTLAADIEEISVDLEPSLNPALAGSVIDDGDVPNAVAGALVTVSQNDEVIAHTVAYANGQFEFHALPGALKLDPVVVDISAPSYVGQSIMVDPDEAEPVEAVLEKINLPGSVTGVVVNALGASVADAQVVVQQKPAGFSATRVTAFNGGYSVASVPDGEYEVRAVVKDVGWGMNNGEVQQSPAQIDVELLRDLRPCVAPEAPTGVQASDGTNAAGVNVTWNPVTGAGIEYQVYRGASASFANAAPLSDWITATSYLDTSAAAPTASSGCNGGSTQTYFYWVLARTASNGCESAPSISDSGSRGAAQGKVEAAGTSAEQPLWPMIMAMVVLMAVGHNAKPRVRASGLDIQ